jgi:hypothetical protein
MPIGRLMKKHQCQLVVVGDVAAERRAERRRDDDAEQEDRLHETLLSRGKIWRSVAWAVESSAAPPAPWSSRQSTSSTEESTVPQQNDATMNRMIENVR